MFVIKSLVSLSIFSLTGLAMAEEPDSQVNEDQPEVRVVCGDAIVFRSSCEDQPEIVVVQKQVEKQIVDLGVGKEVVPALDGIATPPGYHDEERTRRGLWGTGVGMFAVSHTLTVLCGFLLGGPAAGGVSTVPGLGAVISMFVAEDITGLLVGIDVALAVIQTTSLSMVIAGVSKTKRFWVRDDKSKVESEIQIGPGWTGIKVAF